MGEWSRNYFTFNRKEQRGIAILLGLMLLSAITGIFAPELAVTEEYDMTGFRDQVEAILRDTLYNNGKRPTSSKIFHDEAGEVASQRLSEFLAKPFHFNPNELSEEGWKQTGIDDKVIRNILRYKEKGGRFRKKEDLGKIYGMKDSILEKLAPFVKIPEEIKVAEWKAEVPELPYRQDSITILPEQSPDALVELNSADSAVLVSLPGIGPSFASRIIKYRNLLGGFARKDQLLEVRGMDSTRFAGVKDKITIDSALITRMDLNDVDFKEMVRHPYFEYYLVKAIFSYKDKIETIDSVEQLRQVDLIYPELFEKIRPYLRAGR